MVFVAIDADGRPTPVPKWEPNTPEDEALQARAKRLMALGQEIQGELQAFGQAQG
jgi:acyl-CoA hydrolase